MDIDLIKKAIKSLKNKQKYDIINETKLNIQIWCIINEYEYVGEFEEPFQDYCGDIRSEFDILSRTIIRKSKNCSKLVVIKNQTIIWTTKRETECIPDYTKNLSKIAELYKREGMQEIPCDPLKALINLLEILKDEANEKR